MIQSRLAGPCNRLHACLGRTFVLPFHTLQLEAARKAHAFEVTALHDKHASRLQLVEDFKNSVLADRHSAEEQWVKEREALQVA